MLGKLRDEKKRIKEINDRVVSALQQSGQCLHPDAPAQCSGDTIKAHSVSKSLLKKIADENSCVYHLSATPSSPTDRIHIQKRSISTTSTFRGFCSSHDNQLFLPVENNGLELTRRHTFLLAYRAISNTIYRRQRIRELKQDSVIVTDQGLDKAGHIWHDPLTFLPSDIIEDTHAKMQRAIQTNNYNRTCFFAIEFDIVPEILCCTTLGIPAAINGKPLQSKHFGIITLSVLPLNISKGVAIFAWYNNSIVNEKFIASLADLSKCSIPDTLVKFLFHHAKDIYFKPIWWDSLPHNAQKSLQERLFHNFRGHQNCPPDSKFDGNHYVNWKVTCIKTNLKL